MWHEAINMKHPVRLELINNCLLVELAKYYTSQEIARDMRD